MVLLMVFSEDQNLEKAGQERSSWGQAIDSACGFQTGAGGNRFAAKTKLGRGLEGDVFKTCCVCDPFRSQEVRLKASTGSWGGWDTSANSRY